MVHHASDAEPISTQQEALKAPPSKKPSAYVFDSNGDTRIILSTYMAQSFKWEADKIWIEPEKPTSHIINSHDDEADPGFNDSDPSPDSTNLIAQYLDYRETCEVPLDKVELRMLVSGKHLELASPIFKTMLTGPFIEGNADSSGLRRITASDWDPEAFKIVLTIMHGYHRDVPGLLSLEQLAKVAMIVNYYDCLESVEIYRTIWLGLWSGMPTIYGRDCVLYVLLSWVLSNPVPFQTMTQLALRHSQRLIEAEDLPIPADIFKEIDIARQSAIAEVFSAIYELLDRLQDEQECSFECSSMLLGVLTKELGNHRILYPRITPPYNGFSIEGLKKMIKRLKRPSWYQEPKSPRHSCSIQDKLSVSLSKLESKLPVFNLQDFQSVKNDRRV
ncbi:unnamed protein product [Fusarium graminearum]|nr:unnamed protein product [Fusarium graminearum]